jgi:hypothetical protein
MDPFSPLPERFALQADGHLLDSKGVVWRWATSADQAQVETGAAETQLIYDPEASLFRRIIRM